MYQCKHENDALEMENEEERKKRERERESAYVSGERRQKSFTQWAHSGNGNDM